MTLLCISYDSRFTVSWTKCCLDHLNQILNKRLLPWIYLRRIYGRKFEWKQPMVTTFWQLGYRSPWLKPSKPNLNSIWFTWYLYHPRHWVGISLFNNILYPNQHNLDHKIFVAFFLAECRSIFLCPSFVTLSVLWIPAHFNDSLGIQTYAAIPSLHPWYVHSPRP